MLSNKYLNDIKPLALLFLMLCLIGGVSLTAQQAKPQVAPIKSVLPADSQKIADVKKDSVSTAPKNNPNQIDSEIAYTANDSIVFLGDGTGILYGNSDIKYKKINLKADYVRVKMDSSLIFAKGKLDSLGVLQGNPEFTEGEGEPFSAKELTYNLKTKKGFIRQAVTQQGEAYILSDRTKKTEEDALCLADGKYTTCDDHDHPHFYLSLSKAKVKPGSYIATGPAHMVLLDIPLPLYIPFGYFPFNSKYSSGIETPSLETDYTRGYALTNGGYYFAISDYVDLDIKGDIYTRGTWGVNLNSNYLKRYKFNGSVGVSYREDVTGDQDLDTYSKVKNLSIRWTHSQNPKVNPFRTLSASVNFSTSGYNRSNINSYYSPINSENTKGSSISFSQRFPNNPFSISGSMLINQRTKDSTINLTLPNLSISMSRIFPFKRRNAIGNEQWYEKISMSYSGTLSNSIYTKEYLLLHSSLSKDWKNGMQHSIPVSASFNILKYITFTTSANYNERWSMSHYEKSWDWNENTKTGKEITDTIYNFGRNYNFSVGASANTTIYGFYTPLRAIFGDKIQKIRHVMTPSIGVSYNPDFSNPIWGAWDSYTKREYNKTTQQEVVSVVQYSKYAGTMYGGPGRGKSGSINFSLGNNLEMKVKNSKDTINENATRIISLIDNFSVNGSYNMAADSMNWSNFGVNLRLKFKSYSLNLSTSYDPYMWSLASDGKTPVRVNELRWNHGKFPRFMGTGTSFSYTLSDQTFKKKNKKKEDDKNQDPNSVNGADGNFKDENVNDILNEQNQKDKDDNIERDADGYEKVNIPWSLSFNYTMRYGDNSAKFDYEKMDYQRKLTHNVSISGNIQLTPGWQINGTTSYDFNAKQFSYTVFNITRNLHCWTLTGSMVPFGPYKTYSFRIGVNSSMLQDLKYEKQGSRYSSQNNVVWY
ncbi:MAG: putative LPS assembly protein LptD [Paludibacteraceae bacterium]